jgi:hypothetical protein
MNPWLGDNTAEDWDDSRYLFWKVVDPHTGEWVNISRTEPRRDKRGHIKAGERDAWSRWCEEHFDFEVSRTLITGREALAWATGRGVVQEAR